jgi:hypothetical protein
MYARSLTPRARTAVRYTIAVSKDLDEEGVVPPEDATHRVIIFKPCLRTWHASQPSCAQRGTGR